MFQGLGTSSVTEPMLLIPHSQRTAVHVSQCALQVLQPLETARSS